MSTAINSSCSLLGKLACAAVALAVVLVFLVSFSEAATSTLPNPSSYVPGTLTYPPKPTSTSALYTAIDSIDMNLLHLNQEFLYQAVMLDSISASLATITTQTANPASVDLTAVNSKLDAISAKLVTIEQKIDSLGGDGMTDGDMVIAGIMLALIFAVTWKG